MSARLSGFRLRWESVSYTHLDVYKRQALQGEPGEFVAVVRKAKDKYFLGATTNEESRTLTIPLDFLEKDKKYHAVIYADGEDADWKTNPTSYQIKDKEVTAADTLSVVMAKGGGQAVSFIPITLSLIHI